MKGVFFFLLAVSLSALGEPLKLVWSGRAVFDRELPLPADVSFLPHGHYAASVTALPASVDLVDAGGKTVATYAAPTNVPPPYVFHLALSCGHPATLFVTKDGETRVVGTPKPPADIDLHASANLTGIRVVPRGGAGTVAATMSAGVGQADVRFVTRGPSGVPYCEDGRLYFTFSARYFCAHLGVGSIEVAHPEKGWRFEGTILFDDGDGKMRNDLAAHLWLDPEGNNWRAYVSNFSTTCAVDGLGGRAKGGINVAWSHECPLRGFHVMRTKSLGLEGMNEDPGVYYDAAAKKWRLFLSHFTEGGIRACLMESDRWDGGFRPLTGFVPEDSTGTTIALMDGRPKCLTGSADRAYYVYAYPTLEKLGTVPLDVTPWGDRKGWPHGRGWPAYAEVPLPDGTLRKIFLTMDRINFPGMPNPNWTYGKLYIYTTADSLRYGWRGFMLDECRHFFGKEVVKQYLDRMAKMNLNVFHWHLTEDQAWRLDIPGLPELVRYGAKRSSTPTPGNNEDSDGKPYGPFFYTAADVKEIVDYAASPRPSSDMMSSCRRASGRISPLPKDCRTIPTSTVPG